MRGMMKDMNKKKALFVRTTDKNTKDQLLQEGFQLIDDRNGWVFLNKATPTNLDFEELKVVYSNILYV